VLEQGGATFSFPISQLEIKSLRWVLKHVE